MDLTIADYLDLCTWYENLPPRTRALAERFPPGSRWRVKQASKGLTVVRKFNGFTWRRSDYLVPELFEDDGVLVMAHMNALTGKPMQRVRFRPHELVRVDAH